jgi:Ca2+-binding EF-hand superfamily protein
MTDTRRVEAIVAPNVHKHHTHDHTEELKQLFHFFDSNKDGRLSLNEVAKLFRECASP